MRPVKLVMSAFGPYADKTVIDFDKLGENGLYLITGDTGAGKTTIFDGIVYALYGESSSEKRKVSMLRSKYADNDTHTYVELTFEYDRKTYRVIRSPKYQKLKKGGEGYTEKTASCEFFYPDGRNITKKSEVDSIIRDLIGINHKQFLQIAMIAQGDFLKLLLASTDERITIFRHIFKTEDYQELQFRIASCFKAVDAECKSVNSSVNQYISGIICDENSLYYYDIEKGKRNEIPVSETLEILEKIIDTDSGQIEKISEEIAELEKQLEVVNANLGKIQEYNLAEKELKNVAENLEIKVREFSELEKKCAEEKEKFKETDFLNKEAVVIRAELPKYDQLKTMQQSTENISRKLENNSRISEKKSADLEEKKLRLSEIKNEKQSLENAGENREKLLNKKEQSENKKRKLESLKNAFGIYKQLISDLKERQNIYRKVLAQADEITADYMQKNKAFLAEQAGILASQLKAGFPCPVCGSKEHPSPAEISMEAPTEAQLKAAKEKSEIAQKNIEKASSDCALIKGNAENAKENITAQIKEVMGEYSFENAKEKIQEMLVNLAQEIRDLTAVIAEEEKKTERKNQLEKIIPALDEETEKLKNDIVDIATQTATDKAVLQETLKQIEDIKKSLQFDSKESAENKINQLERKCRILKADMEKAQENFNLCNEQVIALKAKSEQLKKQLENSHGMDQQAEEEKQLNLTRNKAEKINIKTELISRVTANRTVLENVKIRTTQLEKLEHKYSYIKALNDTVTGNITGKNKVRLEAYIQMTYFDRIISRANTRFSTMTGGQYEMKRKLEAEDKRGQSGLEIDIIDHYNGTERSVRTLSGGESFKASLSLALGLSDEIQASAGGIKLDTMFVDEGFGSLDDESLSQAMNALKGLSEGNRLVGIISHVNELKERIDKQIIVKKDKLGGSYAKIITE